LLYKELNLTTFDPGLAAALGFSLAIVHDALMLVLLITSVGAFSAVGAVPVVALVIVPAATAYLLSGTPTGTVSAAIYSNP
jgi:manganese/zinc/iron transport system permease protein